MKALLAGASLWLVLAAAAQASPPVQVPPPAVSAPLPSGAKPQPFAFTKLITRIDQGAVWGRFDTTRARCLPATLLNNRPMPDMTWKSGENALADAIFRPVILDEGKSQGFPAQDDADLKITGVVKKIDAVFCLMHTNDIDTASGGVLFTIDWQVYSSSKGQLVYEKTLTAGAGTEEQTKGNYRKMLTEGVRANFHDLLADDALRAILVAAPR